MLPGKGGKFETCAKSIEGEKMRWDETRLITSISTWFISPVLVVSWEDEGREYPCQWNDSASSYKKEKDKEKKERVLIDSLASSQKTS
jgi:hypothetical protein